MPNEHETWRDAMPCPQSAEQELHSPVSLACTQRDGKTSKNNAGEKTGNGARKRKGELNGWTHHPGAKGDAIDGKWTTQALKKHVISQNMCLTLRKRRKGQKDAEEEDCTEVQDVDARLR